MKQKSKSRAAKNQKSHKAAKGRVVAVVAAHPDDEALGCAGTMARHVAEGDEVHVLFMTDGVSSRGKNTKEEELRRGFAYKSCKILGVRSVVFSDFPDNQMDTVALLDIAKKVESFFAAINPEIVYTHHHGDLNIDHRLTQQAVLTAARPFPGQSIRKILGFEVLSSTEWQAQSETVNFAPRFYVDIEKYMPKKVKSCHAYAHEFRPYPHARSMKGVEILAAFRGLCMGLKYAEAFEIYRDIRS